jgi:hypothetical protein
VRATACERLIVAFDHRHRQARVEHRDRDARAHRAAAHHADPVERARFGVARFRRLEHFALGKERVNQPRALRAVDTLQK